MCDTHGTLHELHVVAAEPLGRRIREPGAVFGSLFSDGVHLRHGHRVRPRIPAAQVGAQCKLCFRANFRNALISAILSG